MTSSTLTTNISKTLIASKNVLEHSAGSSSYMYSYSDSRSFTFIFYEMCFVVFVFPSIFQQVLRYSSYSSLLASQSLSSLYASSLLLISFWLCFVVASSFSMFLLISFVFNSPLLPLRCRTFLIRLRRYRFRLILFLLPFFLLRLPVHSSFLLIVVLLLNIFFFPIPHNSSMMVPSLSFSFAVSTFFLFFLVFLRLFLFI